MSSTPRPGLLLLLCSLIVACAPPPAPIVVAAPAPAAVAVAAPSETDPPAEEPFVEEPDPGPVPLRADDPTWGRRDAPVTIVEFADFQCPFSQRVQATLAELRRRYGPDKLRIVYRHYPLPFHAKARPAALLSMHTFERSGNEGFWRLHDAYWADQKSIDDVMAREAARLGLSMEDIEDMAKNADKPRLDAAEANAKQAGITGTPGFLINGVLLSGAQPIEKFAEIIDQQLEKAAALVASGTPRRRVYAELTKAQWKPAPPKPQEKEDLAVYRVPVGKSPVYGKPTALVTIVEFAEFQCPFCGRVVPTLHQLALQYGDKVRFVFKHQPLPFHANAAPAAHLAIEARAQRGEAGFWKAYDRLFGKECSNNPQASSKNDCDASGGQWIDHQQHLDMPGLLAHAVALGLDRNRVNAAITSKKYAAEIEADQDLADDVGAHGTPTFFINGRKLVGAQPIEKFMAVIDDELAKAQALVQSGVKPAQVYERIMASAKGATLEKKVIPAPTRDNPSRGPANAKVVVQWFSDFQCPFCARVRDTIADLEKAYPGQIRVVWRNLPLPFHGNAEPAAEAAMEAFRQKGDAGFWAMFDLLYAAGTTGLDRPALDGFAVQLGLDPARFADALDNRAHRAVIDGDMKVASAAGISGTPAFVINGHYLSGAQPLAKFKRVVKAALAGK